MAMISLMVKHIGFVIIVLLGLIAIIAGANGWPIVAAFAVFLLMTITILGIR